MEHMELLKFVIHLNVEFYNYYLIKDVSGHYQGGERMQKVTCIPHRRVLAPPRAIYPPLTGIKKVSGVMVRHMLTCLSRNYSTTTA